MNLKDVCDKDQYEEPYRQYFSKYVVAYNILRDFGAPEALAIQLVVDKLGAQF